MRTYLVIPDSHHPYACRRCWDLLLAVAERLRNRLFGLVVLGDFLDFYAISRFGRKDPTRSVFVQDEIDVGRKLIARLSKMFPDARKIFCQGNHEERLSNFIKDNCPQLWGMIDLREALGLTYHGWEWVPYGHWVRVGKLLFAHDFGVGGKYFARRTLDKIWFSACIGHFHSHQAAEKVDVFGKTHRVWCPGWLGDIKTAGEYIQGGVADWSKGFSVVRFDDSGNYWHDHYAIQETHRGHLVEVGGEVIRG